MIQNSNNPKKEKGRLRTKEVSNRKVEKKKEKIIMNNMKSSLKLITKKVYD